MEEEQVNEVMRYLNGIVFFLKTQYDENANIESYAEPIGENQVHFTFSVNDEIVAQVDYIYDGEVWNWENLYFDREEITHNYNNYLIMCKFLKNLDNGTE
jgi:hypothetical protein